MLHWLCPLVMKCVYVPHASLDMYLLSQHNLIMFTNIRSIIIHLDADSALVR